MSIHVLVAEDEAHIRRLIRFLLEQEGFLVDEVEDGIAALKAVRNCRPDLLILDIMLPGMDGFEVCRRIRELEGGEKNLPVLFVSARENDLGKKVLDALQANGFVSKVYLNERLIPAIHSLVG